MTSACEFPYTNTHGKTKATNKLLLCDVQKYAETWKYFHDSIYLCHISQYVSAPSPYTLCFYEWVSECNATSILSQTNLSCCMRFFSFNPFSFSISVFVSLSWAGAFFPLQALLWKEEEKNDYLDARKRFFTLRVHFVNYIVYNDNAIKMVDYEFDYNNLHILMHFVNCAYHFFLQLVQFVRCFPVWFLFCFRSFFLQLLNKFQMI